MQTAPPKSTEGGSSIQVRQSLRRWSSIIVLSFIGALFAAYIGPVLSWNTAEKVEGLVGTGDIPAALILLIVGGWALAIVHRWMRVRLRHFRHLISYPPTVVAVYLALLGAYWWPSVNLREVEADEFPAGGMLLLIGGVYTALILLDCLQSRLSEALNTLPRDGSSTVLSDQGSSRWPDDDCLRRWILKEEPVHEPSSDLFGHTAVARRILSRLRSATGAIALQGDFGSGKSTVASLVCHLAAQGNSEFIFVRTSCWGFDNAARAQQEILSEIVRAVSAEVDCLSVKELPTAYLEAAGEHVGWVKTALKPVSSITTKAVDHLHRLSPLLQAIGKRVVVFLEDVDRNSSSFDLSQIQALLVQFREVDRLTFVLAISARENIDFARVCDHFEQLLPLRVPDVLHLVNRTREIALNEHPPGVQVDSPTPLFSEEDSQEIFENVLGFQWSWHLALATALRTPRHLKHVLRRVLDVWPRLYGEVRIDDVINISVLKIVAPEAFGFLVRNHTFFRSAQSTSDDPLGYSESLRKRLQEEWNRACALGQFDPVPIAYILKDVYPLTAIATGVSGSYSVHRQAMESTRRGAVYARRLFTEAREDGSLSDQKVLGLLRAASTDDGALTALAELITESDVASTAFEEFSPLLRFQSHLPLLAKIHSVIRKQSGVRFDSDNNPGFFAAWRPINHDRPSSFEEWLIEELRKCIPMHLRLTTTIYYYWLGTEKHGFSERQKAREVVLDSLHSAWTTMPVEMIARGFDPAYPYTLFHLVFTSDYQRPDTVPLASVNDWAWAGPVLLKSCTESPEIMIPQVLRLVKRTNNESPDIPSFVFDLKVLQSLFGDETRPFLELVANGVPHHAQLPAAERYIVDLAVMNARSLLSSTPSSEDIMRQEQMGYGELWFGLQSESWILR